jgi:oxygen-independent coproporphyrinogen-3 oxidase
VSCIDGLRRKQTPDVAEYLVAVREARRAFTEQEVLDSATARREALMLGLRLRGGIDPADFEARLGVTLEDVCGRGLQELEDGGFLEWAEGRLRLTDRALLVSNEVILRLGMT